MRQYKCCAGQLNDGSLFPLRMWCCPPGREMGSTQACTHRTAQCRRILETFPLFQDAPIGCPQVNYACRIRIVVEVNRSRAQIEQGVGLLDCLRITVVCRGVKMHGHVECLRTVLCSEAAQ